jgi:hypothetical protein
MAAPVVPVRIPSFDGLGGASATLLAFGLTHMLSTLSWQFLEHPPLPAGISIGTNSGNLTHNKRGRTIRDFIW